MILGGGPGTDLWPLTSRRAEPAVAFGGVFRLIDIPVSNCVNSGINQIYVLTQFNSSSLNRHLSRAYGFLSDFASSGFVETLNATQTPGSVTSAAWYQGTADAVRKFSHYFSDPKHAACEDVLVMCADQLYRMDYAQLINYHRQRNADVTIASTPADEDHATHLGVLQVDKQLNVLGFAEKPSRSVLSTMSIDTSHYGLGPEAAQDKPYMASMGIYVFKKQVLVDLLTKQFPDSNDFGRDILPYCQQSLSIAAYPHLGYWEDVGSLKNWFTANLALAKDTSILKLWNKEQPIFTNLRTLPPCKIYNTIIEDSLMGDGCKVYDSRLKGCVVGTCTFIDKGCNLEDVIIFGAEDFDTTEMREKELAKGGIPLGIGANTTMRKVVVDRNARIGANCSITNKEGIVEATRESEGICIRDGILVVMRDAVIPAGTVI